jgi:CelD/BcsL family acetyltransferase involved in cellulose biosynthesis
LFSERPPAAWRSDSANVQTVRPVLALPQHATLADVVPRRARELRYLRRRAEREGCPVSVEAVTTDNFELLFAELVRLNRARWAARGEQGMLPPPLVAFHETVARRLLARGWLRLYGLRLGDDMGAVFYGFQAGDRCVYYLGGFAPHLDRFSPGTLVVGHAIERALAEGASAFDFLRGAEAYKYAWGAHDEPLLSQVLAPPGAREVAHAA